MDSSDHRDRMPLAGVRVVALGTFVAGNMCPLVLAELGAEVVKVESRRRPEPLRSFFTEDHGTVTEPSGVRTTAVFTGIARGTRSVCIELDEPGGPAMLRRLTDVADVFVENLGPGAAEKLGCNYAELSANNPGLVAISISGYGRTGPRAEYRAYASSIANFLGLTGIWGHDGTHFDYVAAYHGAFSAVAALRRRRHTGRGTYVDVSQMDAGAAVMAPIYLDVLVEGRPWTRHANDVPGALLSGAVACRGHDRWLAVELEDLDDWQRLCDVLERDDLRCDTTEAAADKRGALADALALWAAGNAPHQAALRLQRAGLAAAAVQDSEDVWRDPQLRARDAFVEVDHPDLGPVEHRHSPDLRSAAVHRARRLGEDTEAVCTEWLGMTGAEFAELAQAGTVWQGERGG